MWPDDETPEPAAWINFNAATGERNASFICESELASIPLWPEPPRGRKPLTPEQIKELRKKQPSEDLCGWSYEQGIKSAEAEHGITKTERN